MNRTLLSFTSQTKWLLGLVAVFCAGVVTSTSLAQDWGAYSLAPVSAESLVLEAVDSGTSDGTIVSIGKPAATANQKWFITPKGNNFFSISPSYSSTLVLAAAKGGVSDGTAVVLETDRGQGWQEWEIKKNDNGTYSLFYALDKRKWG